MGDSQLTHLFKRSLAAKETDDHEDGDTDERSTHYKWVTVN